MLVITALRRVVVIECCLLIGEGNRLCVCGCIRFCSGAQTDRLSCMEYVSCMVYNGKATACHGHFDLISICFLTVTVICINRKFIA